MQQLLCNPTLLSGQLRSAMQRHGCCIGPEGHLLPRRGPNRFCPLRLQSGSDWLHLAQCLNHWAVPVLFPIFCGINAQRQCL